MNFSFVLFVVDFIFNIFRQNVLKLTKMKDFLFSVKLFQNWPRNQIFCFWPIIWKLTKKSSPLFKPGLPPFSQPNLWIPMQEKFELNLYKKWLKKCCAHMVHSSQSTRIRESCFPLIISFTNLGQWMTS